MNEFKVEADGLVAARAAYESAAERNALMTRVYPSRDWELSVVNAGATYIAALEQTLAVERSRVQVAREALVPFATLSDWYDSGKGWVMRRSDEPIRRDDIERAAAALRQMEVADER